MSLERTQVINFNSGPCALPTSVLEEAAKGLLNYKGTGIGLAELSHRSGYFGQIVNELAGLIRKQLEVPSTHEIIFTQGGATGQFSAVVLNLLARHRLLHPNLAEEERYMDYVVTGNWSKKASEEARRLGGGVVNIVTDARTVSEDHKTFASIPPHSGFKFSQNPAFIYYCENETVDGVQFSTDPESPARFPWELLKEQDFVPVVGDYSSSFLSRPIPNLDRHALVYAGAQKNLGPAGLTVLIVRKDCLVDTDAAAKLGAQPVPITMDWKVIQSHNSLYNTPPMFSMYIAQLMLEHTEAMGGMPAITHMNEKKKDMLYEVLDEGAAKGLFRLRVEKGSRSWMNQTFHVLGDGKEKLFLEQAESAGLKALAGHRQVGGVRISLYNAINEEQTGILVKFIRKFIEENSA
ncbi:phosphoserine aminotransferase [Dacryopinax primogenitus]|uniref:phosphoserine transaminase n=1 Tax=Dacryopinax primogenitus (strain DJM 731) TaxID=1858805 RepID=M5FT69_DACPD|nr:phosphoserine aminotransferase [Dacryopinax primogenitus]EJU00791.1 phosphoserine aminotransferase [Dacryopinax primogenitus]